MTPETYMKRYHGVDAADTLEGCAPAAEKVYARQATAPCAQVQSRQVDDMTAALQLLCDSDLSSLVDFDAFFFLTDSLAIGSALTVPVEGETDNIAAPTASLQRFSPTTSQLLDVDGTAYFAIPGSTDVALDPVEQINVPTLEAVAFGLEDIECELECPFTVYRLALRALREAIEDAGGNTGNCALNTNGNGTGMSLADELTSRNLSRSVTLTVDSLVLTDVTVIGALGDILILGSEDAERFYFVNTEHVEAIG